MGVKGADRIRWQPVLERAAEIVLSYDTNVTLRQVFYQLVSEHLIPNTRTAYNTLSSYSAKARRDGWFPPLIDPNREISRYYPTFDEPQAAIDWVNEIYRRERAGTQDYNIYIAVEKMALAEQLKSWFMSWGISILVLRGYSSQTYADDIRKHVEEDGRESVLIYAGDFDPSGEDILRDFKERTDCWDNDTKVALTKRQIIDYDLPPMMGKVTDSRSAKFIIEHGELIQVELDALRPNDLRKLYTDELNKWWDEKRYKKELEKEERNKEDLEEAQLPTDGRIVVTRDRIEDAFATTQSYADSSDESETRKLIEAAIKEAKAKTIKEIVDAAITAMSENSKVDYIGGATDMRDEILDLFGE